MFWCRLAPSAGSPGSIPMSSPSAPLCAPSAAPLRWVLGGDVDVVYSCRDDGDMRSAEARDRFLARSGLRGPCAVLHQVHGATIMTRAGAGHLIRQDEVGARLTPPAADGQVGTDPDMAWGVFGADCPGLVLRSPDALGIAHCGWRGTAAGIVAQLVAAMAATSAHPVSSWSALIGPGISGPCYEVDAPVLAARSWPAQALMPSRPDHACLDLATALAADCQDCGVWDIQQTGICTHRDPRLHSYRHDGPGPIQLLVAQRRQARVRCRRA